MPEYTLKRPVQMFCCVYVNHKCLMWIRQCLSVQHSFPWIRTLVHENGRSTFMVNPWAAHFVWDSNRAYQVDWSNPYAPNAFFWWVPSSQEQNICRGLKWQRHVPRWSHVAHFPDMLGRSAGSIMTEEDLFIRAAAAITDLEWQYVFIVLIDIAKCNRKWPFSWKRLSIMQHTMKYKVWGVAESVIISHRY